MIPLIHISILNIYLNSFSLCLIIGLLLSIIFFIYLKKTYIIPLNLLIYLIIGIFIGSRIFFILLEYKFYFYDFIFTEINIYSFLIFLQKIMSFWRGGFSILGGILGGILAMVLIRNKYNTDNFILMDIIILSAIITQIVGRIGCFLKGCCWGYSLYNFNFFIENLYVYIPINFGFSHFKVSSISYNYILQKYAFDNIFRENMIVTQTTPSLLFVQLIESILLLLIWGLILYLYKYNYKKIKGYILILYLTFYINIKFMIEFYRWDIERIFFLSGNQIICLILFSIIIIHYKYKNYEIFFK